MKKTVLFALDAATQEVIVSESQKGSRSIEFIERIARTNHELLYDSVALLTKMAQAPHPDAAQYKAMDKVCQLVYEKWRGKNGQLTMDN